MTFKDGPNMPDGPIESHSCGRIIDRETGNINVIIAGGFQIDPEDFGDMDEVTRTYIWDTVTNDIVRVSNYN